MFMSNEMGALAPTMEDNAAEVSHIQPDTLNSDKRSCCPVCGEPTVNLFDKPIWGIPSVHRSCKCERDRHAAEEAEREKRRHAQTVQDLKRRCFTGPSMREWTFANDNGKCRQMDKAHFYVEHWKELLDKNIGYLLWGDVGTGISYNSRSIANALLEQEVSVLMTNFATILNDLTASFEGRNDYIARLCRCSLLIIDDFGMERGTEYSLEQVYNVIDSRYRSEKPLIVTTNLTLNALQHPQDTAHARIYDRLLAMCVPVLIQVENLRRETAQSKVDSIKAMMKGEKMT